LGALKDIRSLSQEALATFLEAQGVAPYRAAQIYQWLWQKGVHDFDQMTNLSKPLRLLLKSHFEFHPIAIDQQQRSADGTIKNAVKLYDGLVVESVLIPTSTRTTACLSSQVGCSLDCHFCATAQLKRLRNLNPDEIFDQVFAIDKQSKAYYQRPLSNIVFMGMGEPLMNYKNVLQAIDKMTNPKGLGMSPRRITLSTSGIPKMIKKMADDQVRFRLAVSLHSARQEVREQIMPFAKQFPLDDLAEALHYWANKTQHMISFEYVVWQGINDAPEDIAALVKYCKPFSCKVNLIEYNPVEGNTFQAASPLVLEAYIAALEAARIPVTYRRSRGRDIDAACGQLANKAKA
jgi:23S rRNA (adenine2503-C2)-methyltransferase